MQQQQQPEIVYQSPEQTFKILLDQKEPLSAAIGLILSEKGNVAIQTSSPITLKDMIMLSKFLDMHITGLMQRMRQP